MKKHIARTTAMAALSLFIGFTSIAVAADTGNTATSNGDQMVVTLPEVVCTAEKTSILPEISYKEYMNAAIESIRERLGEIRLIDVQEEIKSIVGTIGAP
jgi:hypothetical protein